MSKRAIILIIIAVLVVVGGIYWWQAEFKKDCGSQPPMLCPGGSELTCINGKWQCDFNVQTADWQTYRNEEYGFEVKYPKSWKLNTDGNPIIYDPQKFSYSKCVEKSGSLNECSYVMSIVITSGPAPTIENFRKMIERFSTNNQTELGETNIIYSPVLKEELKKDAVYKIKYKDIAESGNFFESSWILGNNRLFNITLYHFGEKEYENIFNQILSTFKFTK